MVWGGTGRKMTASAVEINENPERMQLFIPARRTALAIPGKYRTLTACPRHQSLPVSKPLKRGIYCPENPHLSMPATTIHDILAQFREEELQNRHLGDRFERQIAASLC